MISSFLLSGKDVSGPFWYTCIVNNTILIPLSLQVVCKKYRDFAIPAELKDLTRFLDNAYKQDEFRYTCPNDSEILLAYRSVAKYLNK